MKDADGEVLDPETGFRYVKFENSKYPKLRYQISSKNDSGLEIKMSLEPIGDTYNHGAWHNYHGESPASKSLPMFGLFSIF